MANRAVHIEVMCSLDADSFILALQRLVAQQRNIRSIYSDNGSNFIGAERELKKGYMGMMIGKLNLSCKNKVVTGVDGTRALLWQVIWVEFGTDRFAKQEPF